MAPYRARVRCKARSKRSGKRCRAFAIHGSTVCVSHAGAAPQVKQAAKRRRQTEKAAAAVHALGLPREVDPHVSLLEEVHRTAGHVDTLALIVGELEREQLVYGVTKRVQDPERGETVTVQAALNVWLALYQAERKHLLDANRTAVSCGVAARQVEIAEDQGRLIAGIFHDVFADAQLGLSAEQRRTALARVAGHLRGIPGGAQPA